MGPSTAETMLAALNAFVGEWTMQAGPPGGPAGYEGEVRDGVLTFTGPARHTLTPNEDGTIAWDWSLPGDDAAWAPSTRLTMTRVDETPNAGAGTALADSGTWERA